MMRRESERKGQCAPVPLRYSFVRLGDIIGRDRDQPAIANLYLTMELQQAFRRTAIIWTEADHLNLGRANLRHKPIEFFS